MATAAKKITAEEFLEMDLGDGLHELVRGEIVEVKPPEHKHGYIYLTIGAILRDFSRRTGHGYAVSNDSTIGISGDTVRGADVCYFSEARWPKSRLGQGHAGVPPISSRSRTCRSCPGSPARSPSSSPERGKPRTSTRGRAGGTAMATTTKSRITVEEFLKMDLGDGLHELVRGEIVEVNPPEYWHGYICANIGALLRDFGRRTGHGHAATKDSAIEIGDDTLRGADVVYYREARWPRDRVGQEPAPMPPDLVVEVVSAGDRPGKVLEKVGEYLAVGIPMVWVVYPRRRIVMIYRHDDATPVVLTDADTVADLPELPGFACPVAEFFVAEFFA